MIRRWLAVSGPATTDDLRWWTGWTAGQVKAALAQIEVSEVDLDGSAGLVLAGDDEAPPGEPPWVALLPALDPTVMGWRDRRWFLGGHGAALTDRSGNIGPTVWWDGRVIGGWAQRATGEIAFRLLEDAGTDAVGAVQAEAERLRGWIGSVRVTPRFRTPRTGTRWLILQAPRRPAPGCAAAASIGGRPSRLAHPAPAGSGPCAPRHAAAAPPVARRSCRGLPGRPSVSPRQRSPPGWTSGAVSRLRPRVRPGWWSP